MNACMRHEKISIIKALAPFIAGFAIVVCLGIAATAENAETGAASGDTPEQSSHTEEDLSRINAQLALSNERAEALRAEIDEMSGDRAQQNAALIAAAQRVKLAEIEIGDTEERLDALLEQEAEIRNRLDSADFDVANLLTALERISLHPPPALIIDPADALSSARSAMLLSAVLPQLRQKSDAVVADLNALNEIKDDVLAERETFASRLAILQEEQLRIATLIEARRQGVERVTAELEAEERQAEQLASEAETLNQLISGLRDRIEAVDEAAQAAETASQAQPTTDLTDNAIQIALADADRTAPAVPFSAARGHLAIPAAGVTVTGYGVDDGYGGISRGASIVTRAEARVVAPADGWVMYKGPYLNYGQIIILNPGDGYTILLAGLDEVDVDLGQFVMLGEPVGTMGSRTIGRTVTTSAGATRPTLYIELRDESGPFDPAPWWAEPADPAEVNQAATEEAALS